MIEIIGAYGGYRKTMAFGFTCLVYHATCAFCKRNYDYRNDALGKTTGQMVGAARKVRSKNWPATTRRFSPNAMKRRGRRMMNAH